MTKRYIATKPQVRRLRTHFINRQFGLTLIEASVVLVIAAIVLGALFSVFSAQLANSRIKSTKEKQDAIEIALANYIARNNRLPCPAPATANQGSGNYGVEAPNPGTCSGATNNIGAGLNRNSRGVVPWKTLGLPDEAAVDGYGRRFTYQVRRTETNRNETTITGLTGNIAIWEDASGGVAVNPNNQAVVVIVSHGANGLGAYLPITGLRINPSTAGAYEGENADLDVDFIQRDYSEDVNNNPNPYDDIVMWLSPEDLLAGLQQTGALKSTQGEVNERFESVKNALVAAIAGDNSDPDGAGPRTRWRRLPYADRTDGSCGGSIDNGTADNNCLDGNVPWVSIGLPMTTATDPWGNLIRYTVEPNLGSSTAISGLTTTTPAAANIAFTLTVLGADGSLGTADDLSMSVRVAELRGLLISASIVID